jgi:hypothetical protein
MQIQKAPQEATSREYGVLLTKLGMRRIRNVRWFAAFRDLGNQRCDRENQPSDRGVGTAASRQTSNG